MNHHDTGDTTIPNYQPKQPNNTQIPPRKTVRGFYGKVPAHGDYIERGLPHQFVEDIDTWLQGALACSQGALGNEWLSTYLTCPIWRFGFGEGSLNNQQWLGILCPSVDSVGRYYPLVIVEQVQHENIFVAFERNQTWLADAEALALSVLEQGLNAEHIEVQLNNMAPIAINAPKPLKIEQHGWLSQGRCSNAYAHLLSMSHTQSAVSLWESQGAQNQSPTTFIAKGMPPAHYYTFLLTGRWQNHDHTF